ncbi:MAG: hypothetical protein COV35_07000 [Alphaproteobacteria bacterium CG11_big_fil_rev_8_21_14_0_20_39_49]|nr:MAG: hypothetical protein COV35_07000 [Alphaproteobacteria bacterium CG11_big_fil_rev_8_21_14_0_20_39_49]
MKGIKGLIDRSIQSKDTSTTLVDDPSTHSGLVVKRKPNGSIRNLRWDSGGDNSVPQKLDSQELLDKALNIGVLHNQTDVVDKVLEKGANVNANNRDGDPVLYDAIKNPSRDIVQTLVRAGANLDAQVPSEGETVRNMMSAYKPIPSQLDGTPLGDILNSKDVGDKIRSYLEPPRNPDNAILRDADIQDEIMSFLPRQEHNNYINMLNDEHRTSVREQSGLRQLDTPLSHQSHVQRLEQQLAQEQGRSKDNQRG